MINGLFHPAQVWACALGNSARALLRRGALLTVAGLIGAVGCGFVVFAGYAALRPFIGPELSALVTGITLLVLASGLVWYSGIADPKRPVERPVGLAPDGPAPVPPQPAVDPTTIAVFTAAFVLGRRLADRRKN